MPWLLLAINTALLIISSLTMEKARRNITRKAALAYERRRYQSLVAGLAYNPFPDSIAVRVSGSDAARVIADVKRALPFGISNVSGG